MSTFTLEIPGRPPTMNASRRGGGDHWTKRSNVTKGYLEAARLLYVQQRNRNQAPERVESFTVAARQLSKDRRWLQDVGAQMPAVKACIDGLIDTKDGFKGLTPDDTAQYVTSLRFDAPLIVGRDALQLVITYQTDTEPSDT